MWCRRLALILICMLVPCVAAPGDFSSVEPRNIPAGMFYSGAVLHVHGTIGERSQVAIRITGPLEHHTFNRRGKIGGVIWGGVGHVTFHNAPSLYAVYTSAALAAISGRTVRTRLQLGFETLEEHIQVEGGTDIDTRGLIGQFVRLKEKEGLYRLAPGSVHLSDTVRGRREFAVEVSLPAITPPGELSVTVFEFAEGAVIGQDTGQVKLERVGIPAYLFGLAHARGTVFGLLTVLALLMTGTVVDLLSSRKSSPGPHPVTVLLTGLSHFVGHSLLNVRKRPRHAVNMAQLNQKYRLFRRLLRLNNELLEVLSEVEEESSWTSFRHPRIRMGIRALFDGTADMVQVLNELTGNRYFDLVNVIASVRKEVSDSLAKAPAEDSRLTLQLSEVNSKTAGRAGGKAVNLARIECDLGLRVPQSFVVTTEAYREFLETQNLAGELRTVLAPARLDAMDDFRRRCDLAQDLVEQARIPPAVVAAIESAYRACAIPMEEGLAVRSSAPGEDTQLSFAGQFETVLNVPPAKLADAWKKVVASRFSPRAVFYRKAAGLAEVDTPMAVLVQRMVHARASGVLFTRRPDDSKVQEILIAAVKGLGRDVSAGIASADEFVMSRGQPHRILERRIARKAELLVGAGGGGLVQQPVDLEEQLQASIADAEAVQLAEAALNLERGLGGAQDIEWAIDMEGRLFILQARPLRTQKAEAAQGKAPRDAPLLLHGGDPVWPGRAVGPIHVARNQQEEEETPHGALLVVPQLLPDCVRLLPRVCGIIAERGTVTGHAASILREFRMPSLFGVTGALEKLIPGKVASLDVAGRRIFEGALWPELRGHLPVTLLGRRTVGLPEVLAGKLTRLSGRSYLGTWACRSLHDVIRFAHEMAIESMFEIGDGLLGSSIGGVKRLDSEPQAYIEIVDLGGGISPEAASKRTVKPEDVASLPFRALWGGISDPRFKTRRSPAPPRSLGSVLASRMTAAGPKEWKAPNYACITDTYLNLNSRQAYHFTIVDSFLSGNQNNNHISMRLKGGGATAWQRELRAYTVGEVLRQHHFTVHVNGDLINGWARGLDFETGSDKLKMIGHLLRFLNRLDMWMSDEAQVKSYADSFLEAEAATLTAEQSGGLPATDEDAV